MQITAEQILREARERQEDENYTAPAQKITDPEELAVYRLKERKHFEDRLRMSRNAMGTWLKYAAFEEAQRDFERARSVPWPVPRRSPGCADRTVVRRELVVLVTVTAAFA